MLWFGDHTPKVQWTLTLIIGGVRSRVSSLSAREHVVRPLQTMTNLLAALCAKAITRSAPAARGRTTRSVKRLLEINALGETLRLQRLGRVRSDGVAAHDHGGNRRRRFHFRSRAAFASGQSRRRRSARPADGQIARPARARSRPRRLSRGRRGRAADSDVFPAAPDDGACGAALFANAVCRTSCSC